jgi:hypothetical protein
MNLQALKAYQKREVERVEVESAHILRRIYDGKSSEFSIEALYPELKDTLKGKVHTNLLAYKPVSLQLPFYEAVILPVEPISTAERFKQQYGISVQETIELADQGILVPILEKNYAEYSGMKNEYMDPLLETEPPTFARLEYIDPILVASKGLAPPDELLDISQLKVRTEHILTALGKKGETKAKKNRPPNIKGTGRFDPSAKGLLSGSVPLARYYAELCLRGYDKIADQLIDFGGQFDVLYLASLANIIINAPCLAIGGVGSAPTFDHDVVKMAKPVTVINNNAIGRPFPEDIGKLLIRKFRLIDIKDTSFDELMDVRDTTKEARKALFELDNAVAAPPTAGRATEVSDRSRVLRDVWTSANIELEDLIRRREHLKRIQHFSLSLAVIGPIANLLHGPELLSWLLDVASIAATLSRTEIANRSLDRLMKIKRPNHVQALYDLSIS